MYLPAFLPHFHTADTVCLYYVTEGINMYMQIHWNLHGGYPAIFWVFVKASNLSCRNPVCSIISQVLAFWWLDHCWGLSTKLTTRWQPFPASGPRKPAATAGVSKSSLCCLKQFQEKRFFTTETFTKEETVGLNIRKQKNSKKKIQFPNTTCSPSLLFNKSCKSFVFICSLELN